MLVLKDANIVSKVNANSTQPANSLNYGLVPLNEDGSITVKLSPDEILDVNIAEQKKQIVRCLKKGVKWVAVPKSKQEKQKLNGKQIIELSKICVQIEKHYKKPQDIEWAFNDNKFYIVQSRPITTL